jgi:hypothetical protein
MDNLKNDWIVKRENYYKQKGNVNEQMLGFINETI